MRTLAVLPVKTFSAAKARLAAHLGAEERRALAEAMLGDVLEALAGARGLEEMAVVTFEPRAASMAREAGATVITDTEQSGQSPGARLGIEYACGGGFERVLLVPGDTPLLQPADVDELLRRSAEAGTAVAIVPDRHGTGTNALVLTPPDAIAPSFGPGSRARHVAAAERAARVHSIERVTSLEHDVDTPEDLAAVGTRLEAAAPGSARRTRTGAALARPTGARV